MGRINRFVVSVLFVLALSVVAATGAGPETLLVIEPSEAHPRLSEGDIVELKDGRLCLVYSRFKNGGTDFSPSDLAMRTSRDGGRTWSEDRVLVSGEEAAMKNVMSVSLVRLRNDELLLFYLRLDSRSADHLFVRRSKDELKTLSGPIRVTAMDGYHVVNNDRVVQTSTGRLIVPANLHTQIDPQTGKSTEYQSFGIPFVYYSDDEGRTWKKDQTVIASVADRRRELPLQENGVVELKDGRLWMWMRAWHDFQQGSYSSDGGLTWSKRESTTLASPLSPATVERIPWTGDLLCVWNDHSGDHPYPKEKSRNKRTPLCVAISKDEGKTWDKSRVIEGDPDGFFCYTSMTFVKDRVILSYMARDERVGKALSLKVVALPRAWLYPER